MIHFYVSYLIATIISMSLGILLPEKHLEKRMYGGIDVSSSSKYPFAVLVVATKDGVSRGCTGVIIGARSVLTAAHCVVDIPNIIVKAGSIQPSANIDVVKKRVVYVNVHPNYTVPKITKRLYDLKRLFDLALLTVDSDFQESANIKILPVETKPYADRCWQGQCVTMGWGYYETLENVDELHKGIREGWMEYGGHLYKLFKETSNWRAARHRCELEGGYLADIQTEGENLFLANHRPNQPRTGYVGTWIGLFYHRFKRGRWAFKHYNSSYYPRNFNGFAYGQPKDSTKQRCAAIVYWNKTSPWENGKWKNYDCNDMEHDFWCEKDLAYRLRDSFSPVLRELEVWITKIKPLFIRAQDRVLNEQRNEIRQPRSGDSGSPVLCKLLKDPDNPANPRWRLVGIYKGFTQYTEGYKQIIFLDPTALKFW